MHEHGLFINIILYCYYIQPLYTWERFVNVSVFLGYFSVRKG